VSPSYAAPAPVSAAVFAVLNVASLLAIAPGGVHNVIPQPTIYPLVFFEVSNAKQLGGFGSSPGHGDVPECELRIHALSEQQNVSEAQAILALCINLLYVPGTLAVAGYTVCAGQPMTGLQLLNLGDQLIAGVVCHEEVAMLTLVVQQTGA